jgi:dTDP-4-dehydrorhamnose reductase
MALKPKVFIVGISGMIGYNLALRLRKNFLVSGACFRNQVWIPGAQVFPVTFKTAEVLEAIIRVQNPDFIIGAAGINDRKEVEEQQKVSDLINIMLPVNLSILASRIRAKYIYLGCSEVFDGHKGNYTEEDNEFTITDAVGKQKITAHSYIRAQTLESTVLRVGRVLGIGHPFRLSFFDRIRFFAAEKKPFEASKQKSRSYISVASLTRAVEQIMANEIPNRHRHFHVGGANITEHELLTSWYQLMGADPKLVSLLQDTKRDLSLNCALMQKTYPGWKQETKNELLLSLVEELMPGVGTKKWQKILQTQ